MPNTYLLLVSAGFSGTSYVVEVSGCWPHVGDLVEFMDGSAKRIGEIVHVLNADHSDNAYKMVAALRTICPANRIWWLNWEKPKEPDKSEEVADEI